MNYEEVGRSGLVRRWLSPLTSVLWIVASIEPAALSWSEP